MRTPMQVARKPVVLGARMERVQAVWQELKEVAAGHPDWANSLEGGGLASSSLAMLVMVS